MRVKREKTACMQSFSFLWKEGATPTADNFPLEIAGECTMINLWSFPIDNVFEEINTSEEQIRKELRLMNNALIEHHRIMIEAKKEDIPPTRLLGWLIHKIQYQFTICQ
jgi:hypothetical protein